MIMTAGCNWALVNEVRAFLLKIMKMHTHHVSVFSCRLGCLSTNFRHGALESNTVCLKPQA